MPYQAYAFSFVAIVCRAFLRQVTIIAIYFIVVADYILSAVIVAAAVAIYAITVLVAMRMALNWIQAL
jgi:hypothetical protein